MSNAQGPVLHQLLAEAQKSQDLYQWKTAAKLFDQGLATHSGLSLTERGFATEFIAKCNFKASFQSSDRLEFEESMRLSEDSYKRADEIFEQEARPALAKRALSRGQFAAYWLETDAERRRRVIENCIELSMNATALFQEQGDSEHLSEARLDLLNFFREGFDLNTESQVLKRYFEEALHVGRLAIADFEARQKTEHLLEALSLTIWLLAVEAQAVLGPSEFHALASETRRLRARMLEISREIGTPYSSYLTKEAEGYVEYDIEGNAGKALELFQEGLSAAEDVRDSLVLGRLFLSITRIKLWLSAGEEDGEVRRKLLGDGLNFASKAIGALEVPFATTDLAVAQASCANCHIEIANLVETDTPKRKDHLRKAVEVASKGTGYEAGTWAWSVAAHALAKAMHFLSRLEEPDRKATLLKEALPIRELTVVVTDRLFPYFWNTVAMRHSLALLKSELASFEENEVSKSKLLVEAVKDLEQCLEFGSKWATNAGFQRRLAQYSESYGDVLGQLFGLTKDSEAANRAVQAYEKAIAYFMESKLVGAIGPVRWKTAKLYDVLGDFGKASNAFKAASEMYRNGAREIPGSAPTFKELALYMDAWADIEVARLNHSEGDYESAAEVYTKAAGTLGDSQRWGYLSRLCSARSRLEKAELLSGEENPGASVEEFRKAGTQFQEASIDMENRRKARREVAEQRELSDWLRIASQRETYCIGRIELENAGVLDRKGEKSASARAYKEAAKIFRSLLGQIEIAQDRAELETFVNFCGAWALMKEAESLVSPETFGRAADAFLKAGGTTKREGFRLLAFANASICRALEAGVRYRLDRDTEFYSQVKGHLESAADSYHEAGFKKAENWTRATQRLFDALFYLSEAETVKDHRKKTEFYHLAEKQLELAAKLYGEAGFPGKRKEALEHLGRTRLEKDALLAPMEALSQIPTVPGVSLGYLALTRGQAGGVERFEEACVVGDMIIPQRELISGSEFSPELEVANVGKSPATLVKLQNVAPEGFEYNKEKNPFIVEDGVIDLKGRRIEHLKTYQVKVSLKAVRTGSFELRPRLFYVDDKGNYRSFQFQPATLTVLEHGITGQSISLAVHPVPAKVVIPEGFRFETERAREVFRCLVKDFLHDYMSRRLYVEKAGWRSLMDLVREMKIPRSAVYGPQGRDGPVIVELERRGLVESRIFPKERGRGGAVKKVRVAYENEIVKRFVEETVKASG